MHAFYTDRTINQWSVLTHSKSQADLGLLSYRQHGGREAANAAAQATSQSQADLGLLSYRQHGGREAASAAAQATSQSQAHLHSQLKPLKGPHIHSRLDVAAAHGGKAARVVR
eukprot:1140086-Pelagomonas_calceolata.AAC.1